MLGTNWVTGTARQGVVTATVTLPAGSPPSACESQCLSNLGCAAWSFFGNTCTLFSTAGRWLPAVPGPTIPTSGLRPVVQPNVARSGTPAFTTTTVSALHCASSANLAMRNAYDWNASTKLCRVFDVVGTAIPSTGMFSGVMQHLENGVDMPGSDIENPPPTTLSALSCALRCSQREECRAFSWNISSAVCRIKFATPPLQVGPGNVSGVKGTLPLPGVSLAGTEIATTGFKLAPNTNEYVPNPVRPEQCRADCASNASCVAYHLRRPRFFGSTWTCTLFSAVTAENPNPALFEAGYKGLDFF
jgi:hypothetical protein